MLREVDVIPYLLSQNLITPKQIVQGHVSIAAETRRNRVYKVTSSDGPSYLLKQSIHSDTAAAVAHEARIYHFLWQVIRNNNHGLAEFTPCFYGYDDERHILILELFPSKDMRQHFSRKGKFSKTLSAQLGDVLGRFHNFPIENHEFFKGNSGPAGILHLHRPSPEIYQTISPANLQLVKILQSSPELVRILDELRDEWTGDSFVHYDLKWDNCIVTDTKGRHKSRIKIVDWELAYRGDPCWDVGSIFANYLSFWVFFVPMNADKPNQSSLRQARYPLERMQPSIRAFWEAYAIRKGLTEKDVERRLLRSLQYGAVRMIQTGYEASQFSDQITKNVLSLVQLSLNILRKPEEASMQLLGCFPVVRTIH